MRLILNALVLLVLLSGNAMQRQVPGPVWQKGDIRIYLENNALQIVDSERVRIEIASMAFNFIEPEKIIVEKSSPEGLSLKLVFAETDGFESGFPRELPLRIESGNNTLHFSARHPSFNHVTLRLKDNDEHYFGLIEKLYPYNSKNPDLRGRIVDVDVYAEGARDYAENYASAYSAFYMSSLGYGSFFDTFGRGRYQFAVNGFTEIYHQTDALDWYLFFGADGPDIHSKYFEIIGKPKYVPVWACGPVVWRDQNSGSDEVLADLGKFAEMRIPLTACMIDRPYSDGGHSWSKMNFSEKFARPEDWIDRIHREYGMQVMTWVAPMTFTDTDFPGLLPGFKNYMDLTDPDALAEFERRLELHQYSAGVRGHKMDRADENFPLTAQWNDPVRESETRNKYVYLYAKAIDAFLSKRFGPDQFNYARAAFHRSQPYLSALWGGDSRSNWTGMAGNQANAMRCGFQGFPMWGSDTGGYLGEGRIDLELYARWLQWSAWSGLLEVKIDGAGGSGEDRPPWAYPRALQDVFRQACRTRMQMLPYIYSCLNTSYRNGVLMKPLAYVYPQDDRTYTIWDEYIFGNAFLVAPVFQPGGKREIYLPKGTWYDFSDPQKSYEGPRTMALSVPLNDIPVFVREGAVYVTGDIYRGSSKIWEGDLDKGALTIHAFSSMRTPAGEFIYVDYGDENREKRIELSRQGGLVLLTSDPVSAATTLSIRCGERPNRVLLNGGAVAFDYDDEKGCVTVRPEADQAIRLELHMP